MSVSSPGLYPEIPPAEYFAGITPTEALTQSGIKILLNETPFDYRYREDTDSVAKRRGDLVHQLALGKGSGYEISPFDDYRTKDARLWRDEVIESGRVPVKAPEFDAANEMATIIKAKIGRLLNDADYQTEVPFAWIEEVPFDIPADSALADQSMSLQNKVWIKNRQVWATGMLDIWCPSLGIAMDIKVTPYLAGDKARSHIANLGWHLQSAWYRRGLSKILPDLAGRIRFVNLLIKPDAPHTSRAIEISEGWRHGAEMDCERALRIFAECQFKDEWPGYPDFEIVDEPTWLMTARMTKEMEDME